MLTGFRRTRHYRCGPRLERQSAARAQSLLFHTMRQPVAARLTRRKNEFGQAPAIFPLPGSEPRARGLVSRAVPLQAPLACARGSDCVARPRHATFRPVHERVARATARAASATFLIEFGSGPQYRIGCISARRRQSPSGAKGARLGKLCRVRLRRTDLLGERGGGSDVHSYPDC